MKTCFSQRKDPGLTVWDPVAIDVYWSTHMNEGMKSLISLIPLKTRFFFLFIFYFLHFFTVGRNDLIPKTPILFLYGNIRYFRPVPTGSQHIKLPPQNHLYRLKLMKSGEDRFSAHHQAQINIYCLSETCHSENLVCLRFASWGWAPCIFPGTKHVVAHKDPYSLRRLSQRSIHLCPAA